LEAVVQPEQAVRHQQQVAQDQQRLQLKVAQEEAVVVRQSPHQHQALSVGPVVKVVEEAVEEA
jgi:hypothetical protein